VTGTEWLLLAAVILVPLILAVMVTKWTLDQALKRSRKNRDRRARGTSSDSPGSSSSGRAGSLDRLTDLLC